MKYLACSIMILALSGCTEKGSEPGTESETSETAGTTELDTTTTTGDDPSTTTTTSETTPTSTSEPDETTGTESSGTTAPPIDEDCAFLIGKSFESKKQFPCGPPPPEPEAPTESCPDQVSFTADSFDYQSGDYGVGGTYTCEGGTIVGEAEGQKYQGTIDVAAAELVWDGEQYDIE
ncbi:hypothetical protein [Nannocystis punicea]|uniref:Uncharacterized protein n=1 Tax=Nannocystis punicea TaxID=2995304 RepID=A0ABY7GS95_9BACT|nr:hypothetical protein [Nannocystis poenicansa]WAS89807.1 hypothetical protein O0S08_26750 [Nannocystis poenicansa]